MTDRLYYDDCYLTGFDAQVLQCRKGEKGFEVLLDRSAFYPTSGGQPYDMGTLNGLAVTNVEVEDGLVWHTVDAALAEGEAVHGEIDWPRRWDHMQQHAGDHMIASALHRLMGGVTIGLHISGDVSTIDVAMPEGAMRISPEDIRRIEEDVNERIQRDVPIRCWFPEAEELAALPLRKAPTVTEHVRIVAIGDDEMVACGGTHPSTAGQLGLVKILSVTPARGKMRVAFVAGQRALKDYFRCSQAAHSAAGLLTTGVENLPAALAALQEKLKAAEYELAKLKKEQLMGQLAGYIKEAEILPGGEKLIARFIPADAALVREAASRLAEESGVVALLGTDEQDKATYVFARAKDVNIAMGDLLRRAAQPFGGKGGGRPDFAQGGGAREILQEARKILMEQ